MSGRIECGALSGVDPEGRCNACGEPASLAAAKPGRLMNNAGVRAAAAELEVENLRFRLSMAESNNPGSVLSKHNAMLMAVERAELSESRVKELESVLFAARAFVSMQDQGEFAPSLFETLAVAVSIADGEAEV